MRDSAPNLKGKWRKKHKENNISYIIIVYKGTQPICSNFILSVIIILTNSYKATKTLLTSWFVKWEIVHQIKRKMKKKTLTKIKAVKYQSINYKLQAVNETQFSVMNRQARLVPHFSCLAESIKFFHLPQAIQT